MLDMAELTQAHAGLIVHDVQLRLMRRYNVVHCSTSQAPHVLAVVRILRTASCVQPFNGAPSSLAFIRDRFYKFWLFFVAAGGAN